MSSDDLVWELQERGRSLDAQVAVMDEEAADLRWVAYVDRAEDGFLQVFRVRVGGGEAEQVTSDAAHKTQPA